MLATPVVDQQWRVEAMRRWRLNWEVVNWEVVNWEVARSAGLNWEVVNWEVVNWEVAQSAELNWEVVKQLGLKHLGSGQLGVKERVMM